GPPKCGGGARDREGRQDGSKTRRTEHAHLPHPPILRARIRSRSHAPPHLGVLWKRDGWRTATVHAMPALLFRPIVPESRPNAIFGVASPGCGQGNRNLEGLHLCPLAG